jgi:hypothetical protein
MANEALVQLDYISAERAPLTPAALHEVVDDLSEKIANDSGHFPVLRIFRGDVSASQHRREGTRFCATVTGMVRERRRARRYRR